MGHSKESRPTTPTATRHEHVVIWYLYPLPFPHPHLTTKYTHLRPTAPTILFYGSIFCVLLRYYTTRIFYVPLNLNSPTHTHTYSVLFTVFCTLLLLLWALGIPQCVVHSLYGSKTRGSEDDSVESKHVALRSHYMFNITTAVFGWPSPPFIIHTAGEASLNILVIESYEKARVQNIFSTILFFRNFNISPCIFQFNNR